MEFMLETIFDIKNNKKRPKEETAPHARIKKWLQKVLLVGHYFSHFKFFIHVSDFKSIFLSKTTS